MRKKFKKITAIVLTVVMAFSVTTPVFAENVDKSNVATVYMNANDKMTFAQKMDAKYTLGLSEGLIQTTSEEDIDALIEAVTFATGAERELLKEELATYGVYVYDTDTRSSTMQPRSTGSDVTVLAPTVIYDAILRQWTVTCGGNWKNNNWNEAVVNGNIGGVDAFGVGYTNTSGTYNSYVVDAMAYITDQNQTTTVRTENRSDGDGQKGFGFRLQDYKTNGQYVGYKWYGSCTYDYRFGSYSGIATGYYVHTYSQGNVSAVTFGAGGMSAVVDFTISNEDYSFPAYGDDTPFGVY